MTQLASYSPYSPYSTSFNQEIAFGLPVSHSSSSSEDNIYQIYLYINKREFKECLNILDKLSRYDQNWDGYDALKPKLDAIKNAKDLIINIFDMSYNAAIKWINPHISADSEGNIVLEWWGSNNKKITFYIGATPNSIEYIKSTSEKINEMEDGKIPTFTLESYINFFGWLNR